MSGAAPRGAPAAVRTYAMVERSRHLDFDIRDQSGRAPLTQRTSTNTSRSRPTWRAPRSTTSAAPCARSRRAR